MFKQLQDKIFCQRLFNYCLPFFATKLKSERPKILSPFWLFLWLLFPGLVQAQVTPDGTAGTLVNGSLSPCAGTTCTIAGGATDATGTNLFHSFTSFSVDAQAYFNNAASVQNIISRVTGKSASTINGIISANGAANLFLINPNGIIFTANARLNIGGSFLATTANSLKFADGSEFSAINAAAAPLLTMSAPIGLQFGDNPSAISVQGTGHNLTAPVGYPVMGLPSASQLQVQPGKTLALVGGDINLAGGALSTSDGRIELGSVGSGFVSLNPIAQGWSLGYSGVQSWQDIRLSQQSAIDARGDKGGAIAIQARNVTLQDGSLIGITNQNSQPLGNLTINAAGKVELIGLTPDLKTRTNIYTQTIGTGNSANLEINSQQLLVKDGASISTSTFSNARSGDLNLNVSQLFQVSGFYPLLPSAFSVVIAQTFSLGDTGNLNVSTKQFAALDGGNIGTITYAFGNGGNFILNASESIKLMGIAPIVFQPSAIGTTTFNAGNAGNLIVNTSRLIMRDGSIVNANTFASGNAGSVTVNATESIELSGVFPGTGFPDSISSAAPIAPLTTRLFFGLPPFPTGNSGNVTINTNRLSISDGAAIAVLNQGSGKAGSVQINAGSIWLDGGSIAAATASGEGGNIVLQAQNFLLMRRNALISAAAGGTGNGGNITISSPFAIAVPWENSDIIANTFQGRGGNINIATFGIYGMKFSPRLTPNNDITASSDFGVNGSVTIGVPEINIFQDLSYNLPAAFANVETIKNSCQSDLGENRFIMVGRGGLPPSPDEFLSDYVLPISWTNLPPTNAEVSAAAVQNLPPRAAHAPLIEAQGLIVHPSGKILLSAQVPSVTPNQAERLAAACDRPQIFN